MEDLASRGVEPKMPGWEPNAFVKLKLLTH